MSSGYFITTHSMPKKDYSEQDGVTRALDLRDIDPPPYQHRKYFDEDKLKELAASIKREGLIEPIVVRPNGGHSGKHCSSLLRSDSSVNLTGCRADNQTTPSRGVCGRALKLRSEWEGFLRKCHCRQSLLFS